MVVSRRERRVGGGAEGPAWSWIAVAVGTSVVRSGLSGQGGDLLRGRLQRGVDRRLAEDHRRGVAVAEGLPDGDRVADVGHLDRPCRLVGERLVRRVLGEVVGVHAVSYTHLRAHETDSYLVCRLLLE